ncbi:hypothetical protein TNCV_2276221 [Trichonephila clavipes]|nr:hypothetical protein TNCV_2276221 [Trichonephila clavipes]
MTLKSHSVESGNLYTQSPNTDMVWKIGDATSVVRSCPSSLARNTLEAFKCNVNKQLIKRYFSSPPFTLLTLKYCKMLEYDYSSRIAMVVSLFPVFLQLCNKFKS